MSVNKRHSSSSGLRTLAVRVTCHNSSISLISEFGAAVEVLACVARKSSLLCLRKVRIVLLTRTIEAKGQGQRLPEIHALDWVPSIFTARRVCIARTMPSQDVCLSVRLSHAGIVFKRLNVSSFFSLSSFPVPVPNGRDGNIPTEYCHPVWYGWIRSGCLGNIICVRKYDVNVKSPPTKSSAVAERPRDASDR